MPKASRWPVPAKIAHGERAQKTVGIAGPIVIGDSDAAEPLTQAAELSLVEEEELLGMKGEDGMWG